MRSKWGAGLGALAIGIVTVIPPSAGTAAEAEHVDFGPDRWVMQGARVVEHLGRDCLVGFAHLKDLEFEDGVVEVDLVVNGESSYPGIIFRVQSANDYERLYLRPHRADRYPDAIQYTPVFNGIAGWQLYNGEGYTAGGTIPADQWIHLRLEFAGKQARLYLGDAESPALLMTDLKHGISRGSVGLMCPGDGTAYMSNFSYRIDDGLTFEPVPDPETPPGALTEWMLSPPFRLGEIDLERSPSEQAIGSIEWRLIRSEPSGLVDIARHVGRQGREPDCVFARTVLRADEDEVRQLLFGYSDAVSVFLNDRILFFGNSAYRHRDPSFLGIVGLNDAVYLPLKKGDNELVLAVAEGFGGWGFICGDGNAIFEHPGLMKVMETGKAFQTPESVVYDPVRNVLYVSNFDAYDNAAADGGQYLSKVSVTGEIEALRWVTGLDNPRGMLLHADTLYVAEGRSLVVLNVATRQIVARHDVPDARFLNDIARDATGALYISDSEANRIYRFANGEFEDWLSGEEIGNPNGLHVQEKRLLVANNADHCVKSVDLETREIGTVARLGPGLIDGIRTDRGGNVIVSHWEGRIYRVSPSGEIEKLLDTSVPGVYSADIEYVSERGLLVVPTFYDNRLVAYRLAD